MRPSLLLSIILGTLVTGAYWLTFFALAYGLTAGDHRPGSDPATWHTDVPAWLVWGLGFVVYAAIAWFWRLVDARLVHRRPA